MASNRSVYIQLLIGTFFWGLNFHLAQISTSYLSTMGASAGRYFFAALGVLILYPIFAKKRVTTEMLQKSKKNWGWILLVGLTGVFFFNYFFFKGLETADAINGALIIALNPVFTLIFSIFMINARANKTQIIGIGVSLTGVLIVLSKGNIDLLLNLSFSNGDILLIIASLLFAFHNVLIHKYLTWINPVLLTLFTNCLGAILFISISAPELIALPEGQLDYRFWYAIIVMGFFGTTLSFIFWNNGVKKIGAGNTVMFLNMVPVNAVITGLFFAKIVTIYQLFGGVFIAYGIYLSIKGNKS